MSCERPIVARPLWLDLAALTLAGERWEGWEGQDDPGSEHRSAAPVLLLHGGGQTRHSWHRTGARIARSGRSAIALDARGHGDSGWAADGDYSLDAFVDDVVAWCAQLGPPAPVLVGASLGGITALAAAAEHPGLASALVLVDIVIDPEPDGVRRIQDFMRSAPDGFASLQQAADAISAYNPNRPRPAQLDGLRKNLRRRSDGRWYWHWDPAVMASAWGDEPRARAEPERLRRAAEHLSLPTLIVRGLRSDVVSDSGLNRMVAMMQDARAVDVGAAGHMVAGDDNDVFAAELESFLELACRPTNTNQSVGWYAAALRPRDDLRLRRGAAVDSQATGGLRTPDQTVTAYFDAINAERYDDAAALFAPQGRLTAPGIGTIAAADSGAYFARALEIYPEHRDDPVRIVFSADGRTATVEIAYTGKLADGTAIDFDALDVFDFDEQGRIIRLTTWYDSDRVRRSLRAARERKGA